MSTPKSAKELFEFACDAAAKNFSGLGHHYPTFLFQDHEGALHVLAVPWKDDQHKARVLALVRRRCKDLNLLRVAFIREAWVSIVPIERLPDALTGNIVLPRDDPERKEVIAVSVETVVNGERNLSGMMDVMRWRGHKPQLSKVRMADDVMPPEILTGE